MPSVATLASTLYVLEQYGPTEPSTLLGPVRQGLGRFGDGLIGEEGTTNLYTNPRFAGTYVGGVAPGWTINTDATIAASESNNIFWLGSQAQKVTVTGAGTYVSVNQAAVTFTANPFSQLAFIWASRAGIRYSFRNANSTFVAQADITLQQGWNVVRQSGTPTAGNIASNNVPQIFITNFQVGDVIIFGAAQLEQKAYSTSYVDGALATAWNAPGNLLPTAAQSFEDGTTGGWTAIGSGVTVANSSAQAYAGTKSLLTTFGTAGLTAGNVAARYVATGLTVGKTYTWAPWVYVPAGNGAVYAQADAAVGVTSSITNGWQRLPVTFVATATTANLDVRNAATTTAGQILYLDAVRLEEGTGSASYRWTGAENASTSTRTASALVHALASALPSKSMSYAVWLKVGRAAAGTRVVMRLTGSGGHTTDVEYDSGAVYLVPYDGSFHTTSVSNALALGDSVFIGVSVDSAGVGTLCVSKNGGAVVTATASAAALNALTNVELGGQDPYSVDGVIEQALVFNRALSNTEMSNLAFATVETAFKDDPGIVFATGTGIVRGTTKASTTAGSGYYRATRQVSAYVEPVTAIGSNPDDDTATMKATVPAGSGVGQGALVTFAPDGTRYTVQRVFSPGGVNDELWLAAA